VDERLTPEERFALERHLRGCPDCPREWERFQQTLHLLRSVEEARAPAGFARRVIEAADWEPWPRRLLRRIFLPLHVKLPLEAAALVLVSTLVIFLYRQTPEIQRAVEAPPASVATAPPAMPPEKSAGLKEPQRAVEAPAEPKVTPPVSAPPKVAESERVGALEVFKEKDQPEKKQEAAPAETKSVGGRADAAREARESAAAKPESRLAARAQGPFHLVGALRPKDREAFDRQLNDLVKQLSGVLVRDAEEARTGSIVEVVILRDAYPRLEAGLRQIGEFTVETRAPTFPDQVRVGLRIAP
jgi:hypothetical protein